jgi:hypothetical protein
MFDLSFMLNECYIGLIQTKVKLVKMIFSVDTPEAIVIKIC